MGSKIQDLTTDELRELIQETVSETMSDMMEDWLALNSREYVQSIEEARKDYAAGRVTPLEDLYMKKCEIPDTSE